MGKGGLTAAEVTKNGGRNANGHQQAQGHGDFHPRAPGSQLRNGSITVSNLSKRELEQHHSQCLCLFLFQPPFEENGIASPIDIDKAIANAMTTNNSLGTSIDSAMVTTTSTFAKNRFLSGDQNSRDAMLRRQLFAIGMLIPHYLEQGFFS